MCVQPANHPLEADGYATALLSSRTAAAELSHF